MLYIWIDCTQFLSHFIPLLFLVLSRPEAARVLLFKALKDIATEIIWQYAKDRFTKADAAEFVTSSCSLIKLGYKFLKPRDEVVAGGGDNGQEPA